VLAYHAFANVFLFSRKCLEAGYPDTDGHLARNTIDLPPQLNQLEEALHETAAPHILETLDLAPGEAVAIRQAYNGPNPNTNNFTVQAGSSLPTEGDRFAVQASAMTGGGAIVGIAQEASLTGTIYDVFNVEGFNQ
jgi:hypothetical protein